jgi:hypothetical protein
VVPVHGGVRVAIGIVVTVAVILGGGVVYVEGLRPGISTGVVGPAIGLLSGLLGMTTYLWLQRPRAGATPARRVRRRSRRR